MLALIALVLPAAAGEPLTLGQQMEGAKTATPRPSPPRPAWTPPPGQDDIKPIPVALTVGEGRMVHLPKVIANLFVADPNIGSVRLVGPASFFLFGSQSGHTNLIATDADHNIVATLNLEVTPDVEAPEAAIEKLAPGAEVRIEPLGSQWIAKGRVKDVGEAADIAAVAEAYGVAPEQALAGVTIDGSQQVNIRVRFAEVSRTEITQIGINWEALLDSGDLLFGIASGQVFQPGGAVGATGSVFGSASSGSVDLDLLIDALDQEGFLNILAEPNLTAINGRQASFLAGGEIPIPVPQQNNNGAVTVDYKPFGVSLDFKPTIMPNGRINLDVRPEVSELSSSGGFEIGGFVIPAMSVRRTETSVQLASGQSLAIAGMFRSRVSTDINQFPILGDVPILGALFRSQRYQREETELVILITPYLVTPDGQQRLMTPTLAADSSPAAWPPFPVSAKAEANGAAGFIMD